MSGPNGFYRRFRIDHSASVIEQFKELHSLAEERGIADEFLKAARTITRNLIERPEESGEPMFDLPATSQEMRKAVCGPLGVVFTVHRKSATVFVKKFVWMGM